MPIELAKLIEGQKAELKDVAAALVERKPEKVAAGLATLVAALASGHPELAVLSPFLEEAARRAFVSPATRRLQKAIAVSDVEEENASAAARIVEPLETLIGQALIQMARVQHNTKEEMLESQRRADQAIGDALGGVRGDLSDFRAEIEDGLTDLDVKVNIQRVREGAVGIRVSDGARGKVWIGEMTVAGEGSVGIDLRSRDRS